MPKVDPAINLTSILQNFKDKLLSGRNGFLVYEDCFICSRHFQV